ncbi:MAG: phosphatidate cytidylyltransferase [Pseudomonadota bacterium]
MLKQRILAALILLPLFLVALFYAPGWAWDGLLLAVIFLGAWEWARLARFGGSLAAVLLLGVLLECTLLKWQPLLVFPVVSAAGAFWVVLAPLWLWRRWSLRQPLILLLLGWMVLVPAWAAMSMGRDYFGADGLLFLLGAVWLADSAAYFVGRAYGRHKLAPAISPGKTVEGVVGALLAVAIYVLVAVAVAGWPRNLPANMALGLVPLFWVLTLASVVGDLFESWLKREAGAKDSGALIPGHGGVLDRIDSLTAVLPLALALAYRFAEASVD